jgi:predicted ATP-grasp superfamily ATP-dependent carboligase
MTAVPVVVLNMHYSGLGIARSLGPHGVPVYGLSSDPDFPGNFSRYCQFRLSPDSLHEPEKLRDFLLDFAGTLGTRPIIFPTRDHDIQFLVTHREALASNFIIPLASRETIDRATNKDECLALAASVGIPVPASHTVRNGRELHSIAGTLTYPVIVKPLYARDWRRPGIWETVGHQKAAIIESNDELSRFYAAIETTAPDVSVQEYIPGPDSNLLIFGSYCRSGGEVRAFFTGRKLLQNPPLKGTGLIVEGVPIPEIVPASRQLLKALNFSGISEIEFKRHDRTGVPYLIEINPRHWDQHYLGTACGVNLSWEIYRDLAAPGTPPTRSDDPPAPQQQAAPVRWIAERDLLFYALRGLRHRRRGLLSELANIRAKRTYSVHDSSDPRPGNAQMRGLARDLAELARR